MALTRYGQITGNYCTAVVTFDPDVTSVEEMQGNLGATLLPIGDYLGGQWGMGATFNGIDITQDVPIGLDPTQAANDINDLQSQLDVVTGLVAEQVSSASVQASAATTGSNGQATVTWVQPFTSAPRVVVSARSTAGTTLGIATEVLTATATGAVVRVWQMRTISGSSAQNPAVLMNGATVNVLAFGVIS